MKKKEPLVCLDEKPVQLLENERPGRKLRPGRAAQRDYEYIRKGMANVFAIVAPKLGAHLTHATPNRTRSQYVSALQRISRRLPRAKRIHLVQDNLTSHSEKSCIQVLGPIAGRRLWRRFKVHYTPKHGSWLNMAETEISMWRRECLGRRRIPSLEKLDSETCAWNQRANKLRRTILGNSMSKPPGRNLKLRALIHHRRIRMIRLALSV